MSTNRDRPVSAVAREIQERLAQAQGAPAPAAAPAPAQSELRVTKTGELLPPGTEVPKDENGNPVAFSVVPAATFHARERS
jgi:hypothetical protein